MLGFSQITGADAETGETTQIDGLVGTESNSYGGKTYTVSPSATFTMFTDPGHEFSDVVTQLAGPPQHLLHRGSLSTGGLQWLCGQLRDAWRLRPRHGAHVL
jgi:hypothetical protein